MQQDKEQLCPQAARRQGLGTALQESSCAAPALSWGSYPAMVLDVLIQGCEALSLVLGFRWDSWLDFFWAVQLFALAWLADKQSYF